MTDVNLHKLLQMGIAFVIGIAISYACYALLATLFTWWVALLLAYSVAQPAIVYGLEALRPGIWNAAASTAADGVLIAANTVKGWFA